MTFKEWCCQTVDNMEYEVPQEFMIDIMTTAIRTILEEFCVNPVDADLDIGGIGRFYLNHRTVHIPKKFIDRNEEIVTGEVSEDNEEDYCMAWTVQFKPSIALKQLINGKRTMDSMAIGGRIPLFPEQVSIPDDGKKKMGRPRKHRVIKKKWIVLKNSDYTKALLLTAKYQEHLRMMNKVPEDFD